MACEVTMPVPAFMADFDPPEYISKAALIDWLEYNIQQRVGLCSIYKGEARGMQIVVDMLKEHNPLATNSEQCADMSLNDMKVFFVPKDGGHENSK